MASNLLVHTTVDCLLWFRRTSPSLASSELATHQTLSSDLVIRIPAVFLHNPSEGLAHWCTHRSGPIRPIPSCSGMIFPFHSLADSTTNLSSGTSSAAAFSNPTCLPRDNFTRSAPLMLSGIISLRSEFHVPTCVHACSELSLRCELQLDPGDLAFSQSSPSVSKCGLRVHPFAVQLLKALPYDPI